MLCFTIIASTVVTTDEHGEKHATYTISSEELVTLTPEELAAIWAQMAEAVANS